MYSEKINYLSKTTQNCFHCLENFLKRNLTQNNHTVFSVHFPDKTCFTGIALESLAGVISLASSEIDQSLVGKICPLIILQEFNSYCHHHNS